LNATHRPGIERLRQALADFHDSLFRLETMQEYSGSSEDAAFAEWRRTGVVPLTDELRWWCERVRRRVADGCRVQRVHVVTEPLTEYMRFELASYAPNVAAGEDVRILAVPQGTAWPHDVPQQEDFWLIDSRQLWSMRYAPNGHWLGVQPSTDPQQIVRARAVREVAVARSRPWQNPLPR
jgi:hypothetical protein